jgi:hypothetical protein
MVGGILVASTISSVVLLPRVGSRVLIAVGLLLSGGGTAYLGQLTVTSGYPGHILPALLADAPQRRKWCQGCDKLPEDTVVDDTARDRAIYQALKATDEVAAALQTHLIEEHGADPERTAPQSPSSNSFKLLRQARERLGEGLRALGAGRIAESDKISLRN